MASQLLSRIFDNNSASIYETLREHDALDASGSELEDLEERAGIMPPRILSPPPRLVTKPGESDFRAESQVDQARRFFPAFSGPDKTRLPQFHDDDDNVDVPESLLFEAANASPIQRARSPPRSSERRSTSTAGPSRRNDQAQRLAEQWEAATTSPRHLGNVAPKSSGRGTRMGVIPPKDRALWKWANVENLDSFLSEVITPVPL